MTEFSERQKNLFTAALSLDPPFLTDDPYVNFAVDQVATNEILPYDEALYIEEIEVWERSGGMLLSLTEPTEPTTEKTAIVIIGRWSSSCSACGGNADPDDTHHIKGGLKSMYVEGCGLGHNNGCGAKFTGVTYDV